MNRILLMMLGGITGFIPLIIYVSYLAIKNRKKKEEK